MKRVLRIKRTTRRSVWLVPGNERTDGKPRRVVVVKKRTVARRRTVR
jgi:hypothetical protein